MSLLDRLTHIANDAPDQLAVYYSHRAVTFGRVAAGANRCAAALAEAGVGCGDGVAIVANVSPELIAMLFAITHCGAFYVGVDPEWPHGRVEQILRECGVRLVITDDPATGRLSGIPSMLAREVCSSDNGWRSTVVPPGAADRCQLVNVVYTSGSTGHAKGIRIPLESVLHRISSTWSTHQYHATDRALVYRLPAMIGFSSECFGPLVSGVGVVVPSDAERRDPRALAALCVRARVSHASLPRVVVRTLLELTDVSEQSWRDLRVARTTGERLDWDTVRRWYDRFPSVPLINCYGASECGGAAAYDTSRASGHESEPVPAGRPAPGVRIFILDDRGQAAAPEERGDVYVAGPNVALGYVDDRDQRPTFVDNPLAGGQRMVRTGDIGYWTADGLLVITGRADRQVKIRGYRVALEEVEQAIRTAAGVRDAAVVAYEHPPGNMNLVAYYVTSSRDLSHADLHDLLSSYMMPSSLVRVDAMPLTDSGKVDRPALWTRWGSGTQATVQVDGDGQPNGTLALVLASWCEVLGRMVDPDHDFVSVGGNSILAMQVSARLSDRLEQPVPVDWLLSAPSARSFAVQIDASLNGSRPTCLR